MSILINEKEWSRFQGSCIMVSLPWEMLKPIKIKVAKKRNLCPIWLDALFTLDEFQVLTSCAIIVKTRDFS
jgi:hypothetical protein